jgi:hypothetical protein
MKKLLIVTITFIFSLNICNAQKTMATTDKSKPVEVRSKSISAVETNYIEDDMTVFSSQTFNLVLESQLKHDGIIGKTDKLTKFQLTEKVMLVNSVEVEEKVKDKYLSLYFSFMRMPVCQGCFVSYMID